MEHNEDPLFLSPHIPLPSSHPAIVHSWLNTLVRKQFLKKKGFYLHPFETNIIKYFSINSLFSNENVIENVCIVTVFLKKVGRPLKTIHIDNIFNAPQVLQKHILFLLRDLLHQTLHYHFSLFQWTQHRRRL